MKRRRPGLIWGGRIVAGVALAILAVYLWRVGLTKANSIAGVLSLFVAAAGLVGPYLFPPGQSGGGEVPAKAVAPGLVTITTDSARDRHQTSVSGASRSPDSGDTVPPGPIPPPDAGVTADRSAWIEAVMAFGDIEDPDFRRIVLREMGDRLGLAGSFLVPYRPVARDHVVEIVYACWDFRDPDAARRALAGTLISMRPQSSAAVGLSHLLRGA